MYVFKYDFILRKQRKRIQRIWSSLPKSMLDMSINLYIMNYESRVLNSEHEVWTMKYEFVITTCESLDYELHLRIKLRIPNCVLSIINYQ